MAVHFAKGEGSTVGPSPSYHKVQYDLVMNGYSMYIQRWLTVLSGSNYQGTKFNTAWDTTSTALYGEGDYFSNITYIAQNGPSNIPFGSTITIGGSGTTYPCYGGYASGKHISQLSATISMTPYKVTFNSNGGTVSGGKLGNYDYTGSNFIVTMLNYNFFRDMSTDIPTRANYTFLGWYTATSGGTQVYQSNGWATPNTSYWDANQNWIYKGNVNVYAQWQGVASTVTFNANGGSTSTSSKTVYYGSTYGTLPTPTRSGYRFKGWYTSTSGGTNITASTTVSITSAQTLYAQWVAVYYLDLNVYLNGSVINNTSICHCDVAVNGSIVATNVCDYYSQHDTGSTWSMTDWAVASGYTLYNNSATSGTLTSTTNCNIYIGQNYTVTYKANGGSGSDQTQTVNYGTSWTTKGAVFTRTGYTQIGWNTASDGSGTSYSLSAAQTSSQSANVTLYAVWTEHVLTVNYYSNYADYGTFVGEELNVSADTNVLVNTSSFYYDDVQSNGLNDVNNPDWLYLTRTGYTATGYWGTSPDGGTLVNQFTSFDSGQAVAEAFGLSLASGNASINVYVQWKRTATMSVYPDSSTRKAGIPYVYINGTWKMAYAYTYDPSSGTWKIGIT